MQSYPQRDSIDDDYTWDLTAIYETRADWAAAADRLEADIETLESTETPTESAAALAETLAAIESALVRQSRLELYALLRRNEATGDDDRRDDHRRARRTGTAVDEAVRSVRRRIHRDADRVREFVAHPELDGWAAYVDDLLAQAPHTRSAAVESVLAGFEPVIDQQTDTIVAITEGDVDWPTLEGPKGTSYTLDRGTYREAMDHPDRSFRERAHEAHLSAMRAHDQSLAAAVAEKIRAQDALAEARHYESPRAMALARESYPATGMHDAFPVAAHDAVVEQVRAHADAYHDLLESRREALGVDVLRPWDESAPLVPGDPPSVDYETVRDHLLAAVSPLGDEYRERLAAFLDDRRVDVYPTAEKRTDIPAYCPSSPDVGAFVLANFREDVRTAFFLAHELGHAMHVAVLRDAQPSRYVTIPQPISEVPSILHELLFADHLLSAGDESLVPHVRERRAEFLGGNVFGSGRSAAFLHDVYETVADGGDLTPDGLAETYADYASEVGAPVEPTTPGEGWRQHAFAREPYHSYQYVVGAVAAVSLFHSLRDGTLGTDDYLEFLATTGKRDSLAALEAVGVDVTAPEPYDRVAAEVRRIADNRV